MIRSYVLARKTSACAHCIAANASVCVVTLGSMIILLVISGICGAVGRSIAGGSRTGCLGSIALGYVHRDFADAATPLTVMSGDAAQPAAVTALPFVSATASAR